MVSSITKIKKILTHLGEQPGVVAASIVSREGLIIESHVSVNMDLDALGATIVTGFVSEERIGSEMQLGYLNYSILEYEFGKILTAACGENILAVVTHSDAIIGNIRHQIRKFVAELGKLV